MSNQETFITVSTLIAKVADRLDRADLYFGHGTGNALDEAFALVFQVLRFPFDAVDERLDSYVTADQEALVLKIVDLRIREKKPLPYLVNEAYFAGLPFYVDERVLIPRSPMAELITNAFSPWIRPDQVGAILDLCTGSGCIAVTCAVIFPKATIDAVDISEDALAVSKINVDKHGVSNQVNLVQSDLFENLSGRKYDIIISNPPYVSQSELGTLPKEYSHEPEMALLAEDSGLSFVVRILQSAAAYLTEHGILIVEIGDQREALEARFPDVSFLWLDFEMGESDVFLLTADQLVRFGSTKYLDK